MAPKITIVGSVNMDLTAVTDVVPGPGETMLGTSFTTSPGGKGANQAVAAARLAADVTMIGALGDDMNGQLLREHLQTEGVHFVNEKLIKDTASGIAHITVSHGENRIIVVPGANHAVTPELVRHYAEVIRQSDIVLVQLEIPLAAVREAVTLADQAGVPVILNPAPAQALSNDLLQKTSVLTPNEHEYEWLFADTVPKDIAIAMTKGDAGTVCYQQGEKVVVPAFQAEAVDTTGAGDAFNAALAYRLGEGYELQVACRFANAVAALAVTKAGAQKGMPTLAEVQAFVAEQ